MNAAHPLLLQGWYEKKPADISLWKTVRNSSGQRAREDHRKVHRMVQRQRHCSDVYAAMQAQPKYFCFAIKQKRQRRSAYRKPVQFS